MFPYVSMLLLIVSFRVYLYKQNIIKKQIQTKRKFLWLFEIEGKGKRSAAYLKRIIGTVITLTSHK